MVGDTEGRLLLGDCRERLRDLPECSVDAIVTDPPYELEFMGKAWDGSGVAYDRALWAECLRVLKPGEHLLAFGGTRTYHRMAVAIEDAGFEIRDSIHWLYGSGFPKSLDVSKAIDRMAGAQREVVGKSDNGIAGGSGKHAGEDGAYRFGAEFDITAPATDAAKQWSGWGTALKPAHEPIVVARKPLVGTVAANVLTHGTGALNIDGCRVGNKGGTTGTDYAKSGLFGIGGKHTITPLAAGRWPANLVLTHSAECGDGCADGCPVAELDGQSGWLRPATSRTQRSDRGPFTTGVGDLQRVEVYNDTGGASRFFTVTEWDPIADVAPFRYVAKPSKAERNAGGPNTHPTVKPVALMRHLVRLVTPPGGTVLDPFLGSGTTAMAAVLEGFDWLGIEMTAEYVPIIEGRVKHVAQVPHIAACRLFDLF